MKKKKIFLSLFLSTMLFSYPFLKGIGSLSWFDKNDYIPNDIYAESVASYFGGGKGTQIDPYQIKSPRHFYNLSWLQYLGRFNQIQEGSENTLIQYYFSLENDIDMKGYVLPPIGSQSNPFIGNFNGKEHVVNNLTVSDDFSLMTRHPVKAKDYVENSLLKDTDIIGTFGVVGLPSSLRKDYTYDSSINSVSYLYLENVNVKVKKQNVLAGVIVGYANASVFDCGAHYSSIQLKEGTKNLSSFDKVSKYALIGDYDSSLVKGEGNFGYGSSLNIKEFVNNVMDKDGFKTEGKDSLSQIPSKTAIPLSIESYDVVKPLSKWASISNFNGLNPATIVNASYMKAKDNNIGYFVGSGCKVYKKEFSDFKKDGSITFYKVEDGNEIKTSQTDQILEYLQKQDSEYVYSIRLNESQTLKDSTDKNDTFYQIEEGKVNNTMIEKIVVPYRCIWFAPQSKGTLRFAFYGNEGTQFTLSKIKRTGASGSSFEGGFNVGSVEKVFTSDANIITKNKLYYYEYTINEPDYKEGYEYMLSYQQTNDSNAPYFVYLDVGQNGDDSQEKGKIENIDFLKKVGSSLIKTTEESYTKSDVLFEISPLPSVAYTYIFYFRRHSDDSIGVLYYVDRPTGSSLAPTKKGSGNATFAPDSSCES